MKSKVTIDNLNVSIMDVNSEKFISLTDIAKKKNPLEPRFVIINWLRNRNTVEFLGIWESIHNPKFNRVEFDTVKKEVGLNSFTLSPSQWIKKTDAIGLVTKSGRYDSGTYAHEDIALEFASWISAEFKLYFIKEFRRLKYEEVSKSDLQWNVMRTLSKINYAIHTDAIKNHLIPENVSKNDERLIYATEADVLNLALFSMTAKEWKENNSTLEGNIRDYANVSQLVCLSNLENLNSIFIKNGLSKEDRLEELNKIAIEQMTILVKNAKEDVMKLEKGN